MYINNLNNLLAGFALERKIEHWRHVAETNATKCSTGVIAATRNRSGSVHRIFGKKATKFAFKS